MFDTGMQTTEFFNDESRGLTRFRKVVEACDEFESTWKSGERPMIESWIGSMANPDRALFLKELLELEIELRLSAGEIPRSEEYEKRFPDDLNVIVTVLQGLAQPLPPPANADFELNDPGPSEEKSLGWVGRNELLARIGGGGMGVVFRALQHDAKRIVALKLIRPDIVGGALTGLNVEAIERFRNEATATARLKHANIVTVYDVGEFNGRPFYTMEYIEGKSLSDRLVEGPIEELTAARYLEQISRAVHQAHLLSLLHRDIKPGNILIDKDDKPLITDFGLVKLLDNAPHLSMTTGPLGTPCYMSPEQARGDAQIGVTSDVYNIGATLYELITGRPPFRAASNLVTLRQVCDEDPAPPKSLNPAISKDLETICLKCLQKDSARRYQTAEALANDFKHLLNGEPIDARPVGSATRMKLWAKRNPKIAALSLTVYVLLAMLAAGLTLLVVKQNDALRITNQSLVREYLGKALPIAEGARTSDALPWLAAAIQLEDQAGVLSQASQTRLAAILRQSPKPYRIWASEGAIREGVLSPSGRLIATVSGNQVEIWDVEHDTLLPGGTLRYGSRIVRLLFSPDERLVATALGNGEVQLTEVGKGTLHKRIKVSATEVNDIAFSPDGKRLAAASETVAGVCSVETCQVESSELPHRDRVNTLAFSPNGKTLAVGVGGPIQGKIGDVVLWDLSRTPTTAVVLKHDDDVNAVVFSNDGKILASASYDHYVRLWDTSTLKVIKEWDLKDNVGQLSLSPDGRRIAAATGDLLYLLEVDSPQLPEPMKHPGTVLKLKFSADGQKVAAACDDWTTRVLYFSARNLVLPALVHSARVNSIGFSPDGRFLLTASEDRTARLWDLACGQGPKLSVILQAGTGEFLAQAIGSRDGRRLLLIGMDGTARVFETNTGNPIGPPLKFADAGLDGDFHPNGSRFGTIDKSGQAAVWDAVNGSKLFAIPREEGAIVSLMFSGDGTRLVTAGNLRAEGDESGAGLITLRDSGNGKPVLGPIRAKWTIEGVAVNPDMTAVAAFDKQGRVQIWSAIDGHPIGVPIENTEGLNQIEFSPDGKLLAGAGKNGKCFLWNVAAGMPHGRPLIHDQAINRLAFSADGQLLATAGQDRFARIWDVETTEPHGNPMPHAYDVNHVSFTKDGRFLVTASGSPLTGAAGESIVWETSTGYPVNKGIAHRNRNYFSRCLEDGETFLTISKNDPVASLWQLPKMETSREELLAEAAIVSGLIKANGTDNLLPVSAKTLADQHREFRRRHPSAFAPSREDLLRWHDSEAANCEARELNGEALNHLNALVEAQPASRDCLTRRAKVFANLRKWPEALHDYERATQDGEGDLYHVWYPLQILRASLGEIASYRAGCESLLRRYNQASSDWERNNVAYICSLYSDALRDYQQLLKMTEIHDKSLPNIEALQDTRAAVLYRVKHYDEALTMLEGLRAGKSKESHDPGSLSRELLVTMTYARLNRRREALQLFSEIEPKIKEILNPHQSATHVGWQESLRLEVLLKETREVLDLEKINASGSSTNVLSAAFIPSGE